MTSPMDETKAREILKESIRPDDSLGFNYISWNPNCPDYITLDDLFETDDLEAIIWWMRNKGKR